MKGLGKKADGAARYLALRLLAFYQRFFSAWLGGQCRFYPTCSRYAQEAFMRFSFFKALWKTVARLARCHPFHPGGYDPVAPEEDEAGEAGRQLKK